MGSKGWAPDLAKMEDKLFGHIKENKKIMDTCINAILIRLSKMEKDMETWQKEKEEWEKDRTKWEEEKIAIQAQLATMKGEMTSLWERSCREEGEILEGEKEAMKEELTKALAETIEAKTKAIAESIEGKMEATKEGWVEIVRKNLCKEVRVFAPSPPSCRRIIVATNIAETSLTVDGVVFVIDPGVVKQHQYAPATGMYSLVVVQISRVQATQRAGRAGRTRPGKCYRLYTEAVFENELPAVTVPEIQRSSLTGAVLHLKSLNLKEVNVLEFEFLDPPSRASLEDALQQLFIIDAIHEDGSITSLGKRMAALPLEPSLSRALLAAEEAGCLNEALTVAGMLSCESLFMAKSKKSTSHKRDLEFKNLPDGKGLGDHIQLLQIYEEWREDGFSSEWCEQHGIKTRSMMFARDVRKQLSQIVQWESKGSSRYRQKDPNMVALRRALCIGFSNRLAHRMQRHNGYRTLGVKSQLVQVHPSACSMEVDDDGLLPEWVVYNELVNTGRPYIRNVCVVKGSWCQPALMKLSNLSLSKLGGTQSDAVQNSQKEQQATVETETTVVETPSAVNKDLVAAARERFLARKQART
ncbi:hypothetical protein L7F22_051531 [Adiantum nelumboides]|nr:hypothetical protein [Adiantum nelumboides]